MFVFESTAQSLLETVKDGIYMTRGYVEHNLLISIKSWNRNIIKRRNSIEIENYNTSPVKTVCLPVLQLLCIF